MSQNEWSKPYCGYTHKRVRRIQLTVLDWGTWCEGFIFYFDDPSLRWVKNFENIEQAKSALELEIGLRQPNEPTNNPRHPANCY